MALLSGPLRLRIDPGSTAERELARRAAAEGIRLALPGEEADLLAVPAGRGEEGPADGERTHSARPPRRAGHGAHGSSLSPRELEILEYLVDGWSNAEIASVLRIGVRTVRFHLEGIFAELGVSRRGEAAREALRLGLVRFDL